MSPYPLLHTHTTKAFCTIINTFFFINLYTHIHFCPSECPMSHMMNVGTMCRTKKKKLFVKHVTHNEEKTRETLHICQRSCHLTTHTQYTTYIHRHSRCFFFFNVRRC